MCTFQYNILHSFRSFYYSEGGDITRNLTELTEEGGRGDAGLPIWQRVKNQYFWNESMLECLISVYTQYPQLCDPWIIPVMQVYNTCSNTC